MADLISIASKKHSQGKMQGKFYSMKVVSKSGEMWSKSGGSRQAHYEKVAQGRRNEALLANRAAVEDIAHQIVRNRERLAEATSSTAVLVSLTSCRLGKASFVELEEFLRCHSKTEK